MPLVRCLRCGRLDRRSPCTACRRAEYSGRNAQARQLGPCPQTGTCRRCGLPATANDPFTWGHRVPFIEGGRAEDCRPEHRSCNSSARNRR